MAKIEEKKVLTIDGAVYNNDTKTFTIEGKSDCIEIDLDDVLSKIDGCVIKLVASSDYIGE